MYKVSQLTNEQYGNVIEIIREEVAPHETPFMALNAATTMRRLWGKGKIRFLIDGQLLTFNQAEHWSNEEYKSLPKCEGCAKILSGNLYTHNLSHHHIFCSQTCADKDYAYQMEKLLDEEDCECF